MLRSTAALLFCGVFFLASLSRGDGPLPDTKVHSVKAAKRPPAAPSVTPRKAQAPTTVAAVPAKRIALPALTDEALRQIAQQDRQSHEKRVRVGLGRPFEAPLQVTGSTGAGEWVNSGGGRTWAAEVTAQGAQAVRVHLANIRLPANGSIRVYSPNRLEDAGTIVTAQSLGTNDEVWAASCPGGRALVECYVPSNTPASAVQFTIPDLSHIYRGFKAAGDVDVSCIPQIACYADWLDTASGVALMEFVDKGDTFLCTGCLLNDSDPSTFIDYFLSAHHCIPNATVAATLELFWFYQAGSCNGVPPSPFDGPHTMGGGTLLATSSKTDFTLLRLNQPSPDGATFLGWTTAQPGANETLACIQHPGGEDKRISFGNAVDVDLSDWYMQWNVGVTEEGSSGSPLLNSEQAVIGQLEGGSSTCSNPNGIDGFGRFDLTYKAISRFIDNPFATRFGTYNGLFYEANGVSHESSGAVTVKINNKGSYSGSLYSAGVRYGLSGKFTGGTATKTIKGKNGTLTVTLMINLEVGASNLLGTVSGGTWTSDLYADPVPFNSKSNPAPSPGTYTVVFSPQDENPAPPGSGYGTIKVDTAGKIKFTGSLADGTKVSQSSLLTSANEWPMYLPLYKGQGSALGWLAFATEVNSDVSGDVVWIKKPQKAKYYPAGFTNSLFAVGFKYTKPVSGQSPLGATTATFTADGGGLGSTYTSAVTISSNGKITGPGNSIKLSVSPSTGILSGKFTPAGASGAFTARGIVLQRLDSVYGYFLGTSEGGSLTIVTP